MQLDTTIEQVTSFKVNGVLFDTKQAAERQAACLRLRNLLDETGIGRGGDWDADMVYDVLLDHAKQLKEIFADIRAEV